MSRKKWTVSQYDKDMAAELAESYELDPFAALLLVSRGVTADNADEFLYPQCDIDPFLLPDMEKAANRIRKAIESFEKSRFSATMTPTVLPLPRLCTAILKVAVPMLFATFPTE